MNKSHYQLTPHFTDLHVFQHNFHRDFPGNQSLQLSDGLIFLRKRLHKWTIKCQKLDLSKLCGALWDNATYKNKKFCFLSLPVSARALHRTPKSPERRMSMARVVNLLIPCANFFTLSSIAPHKHSLLFSPVKRVVIWTCFEVILTYLFEKYMFILYNKHINKHYPTYLIMMTDLAVVEERISHNTFSLSLIILLQKVLIVIYKYNQQF